jgi:hypothetical protein
MITHTHGPRSSSACPHRLGGIAGVALLMVLSAACGGGGTGRKEEPPETFPGFSVDVAVTPATAYWGTAGARFVVSGGSDLTDAPAARSG